MKVFYNFLAAWKPAQGSITFLHIINMSLKYIRKYHQEKKQGKGTSNLQGGNFLGGNVRWEVLERVYLRIFIRNETLKNRLYHTIRWRYFQSV